jgi:hypothetical protein
MSLKPFAAITIAATTLTLTIQEAANAAALRFVQQVGNRFDYGLTITEPIDEFTGSGTTVTLSGAAGITGQELGGDLSSKFASAGFTSSSATWTLVNPFALEAPSPFDIPLDLLRLSIFSANPLGTGTFAINRVNQDGTTTPFTGSLPVPIPTPALLPGLVALGVATLKKRQRAASDAVSETTEV